MTGILQRLAGWFGKRTGDGRPPTAASLVNVARQLASTQANEYDCRQDGTPWMERIHDHLARCPDCRAEFEALLHILTTEST
jgi:ribosomal protein L37AE/L43A